MDDRPNEYEMILVRRNGISGFSDEYGIVCLEGGRSTMSCMDFFFYLYCADTTINGS